MSKGSSNLSKYREEIALSLFLIIVGMICIGFWKDLQEKDDNYFGTKDEYIRLKLEKKLLVFGTFAIALCAFLIYVAKKEVRCGRSDFKRTKTALNISVLLLFVFTFLWDYVQIIFLQETKSSIESPVYNLLLSVGAIVLIVLFFIGLKDTLGIKLYHVLEPRQKR
jgi:hypothetical protein